MWTPQSLFWLFLCYGVQWSQFEAHVNYNRDRGVHELQVNHIERDTSRQELLVGISIDLSKACDKIDHKVELL